MSSHEFRVAKFPASPQCAAPADAASDSYELAVNYFLEEFAGDMAFVRGSEPEQMPHLVAALNIVTSKAVGRYLSATASDVRGSVTAGRYSATNVRVHQPRSPGFVKR